MITNLNTDENNNIIKPHIEDSLLFSTSLIFEQNIEKLWLFLRDLNNEIKIVDYLENLKYTKGDNTWTKGNICEVNWVGLTPLKFKCISIITNKDKKAIKWKGKGDIGIKYYRTFYLYRITLNQKTLVKCVVCQTENENELNDFNSTRNYFLNLEYNILLKKSKYLNNIKEDINIYESCIIKNNFLKIWEFIIDIKKMCKVADFNYDIEYNDSNLKEGSFIKYYSEETNENVFMRIIEIKRNQKRKFWWIRFETISTNLQKKPKFIENKITIIDTEKVQLSLLHKFSSDSNQEFINNYKNNLKEVIIKFKKYFEEQNKEDITSN